MSCPTVFFSVLLIVTVILWETDDNNDDDNDNAACEIAMFILCWQGVDKGCRYKHGVRQTVRSDRPQWHWKNHASPNTRKVC